MTPDSKKDHYILFFFLSVLIQELVFLLLKKYLHMPQINGSYTFHQRGDLFYLFFNFYFGGIYF